MVERYSHVVLAVALAAAACTPQRTSAPPAAEYRGFAAPQRVAIRGYSGDAMEPFITRDGRYLFFNNRNDPRVDTNLHYAERVDDLTFDYRGELQGANSKALDAVPSMDRDGNFYFISTRTYFQTFATLYRGRFRAGTLSGVELVPGVSLGRAGALVFDAEISPDGDVLFMADGEFAGGEVPKSADIAVAVRHGAGFRRHPASDEFMRNVNTAALEYAPAISADLLELFFTRAQPGEVAIYRSRRASRAVPFGVSERVAAITGFAEAPSLSADGRSLYYHRLDGERYAIYRVTRP